jgi:formylglycine-generating enzyme required for sulfatase activity
MKIRLVYLTSLLCIILAASCSPSNEIATTSTEVISIAPSTTSTLIPTENPTVTYTLTPEIKSTPPPTITPILSLDFPKLIYDDFGHPMVLVPEGVFQMGMGIKIEYPNDPQIYVNITEEENLYLLELGKPYSEALDGILPPIFDDELPLHSVFLDTFYIDQYEVTNYQYRSCVEAGFCERPSKITSWTQESYFDNPKFDDYPVIYVRWEDALSYCNWRGLRLPTEAEWEKAARGPEGLIFPWGDTFTEPVANICDKNCSFKSPNLNIDDRYVDTSPVGFFPEGESHYGAMDMAGNVLEWVNDIYVIDYYLWSPTENPPGPEHGHAIDSTSEGYIWGTDRVIRGGSFATNRLWNRSSARWSFGIGESDYDIGFRCAMSLDNQ